MLQATIAVAAMTPLTTLNPRLICLRERKSYFHRQKKKSAEEKVKIFQAEEICSYLKLIFHS